MDKFERVLEVLECMEENELLALHRAYCEKNNCMDDYVYEMGQFDEEMEGKTPLEILDAVGTCGIGERFDTGDSYFVYTIWEMVSAEYAEDLMDLDDLARNIVQTGNDYGNSEIAEALEEVEEEEDE